MKFCELEIFCAFSLDWTDGLHYELYLCGRVVIMCNMCFNIEVYVLLTECVCVPCGTHSKQRLFPRAALTGWFL
jgi:hypothetical protein